jgi:Ca-activated chloride channel family protein
VWALWGLAPLLPLLWLSSWREGRGSLAAWRGRIDDHLLAALTVGSGRRSRLRPIHTLLLALALGCVGLAGPAWQREPLPLAEDRAPLVVALDLSPSMDAVDMSPTRLEQAKLKLRALLARRQGARTALLVFGASAHGVLPLTEDPNLLLTYVPDLTTGLMPPARSGKPKAIAAALALATRMLEKEPAPGSILFLTDGFEAAQAADFVAFRERSRSEPLLLAFGGDAPAPLRSAEGGYVSGPDGRRLMARLGRSGLEAAAAGGLWLASATADEHDLDALEARLQHHMAQALAADPGARWRDEGVWLALPAAVLLLLGFCPGWTVRWGQALVLPLCLLLLGAGWPAAEARAGEGDRSRWRFADLWASRDQQGRWQFERGRFEAAARSFADPLWRGIALYRAGHFEAAAAAFAAVDTAEGQYNLGNALARLKRYPEAVAAYDQALARRPGWPQALANRALVAGLLPRDDADANREGEANPDELDQSPFGEKQKGRKLTQRRPLTEAEIARLWLARIQLSPAGFLKNRFALEVRAAHETGEGSGGRP